MEKIRAIFDEYSPIVLNSCELIAWTRNQYMFTINAVLCCHFLRRHYKISKPYVSFILAMLMSSMYENVVGYIQHAYPFILRHNYAAYITFGAWILINYSPFDLVYKLLNIFSPIIILLRATYFSNSVLDSIKFTETKFSDSQIKSILLTLLLPSISYIPSLAFALLSKQKAEYFSVAFNAALASAIYLGLDYYYNILGHDASFPKDNLKYVLLATEFVLELIRYYFSCVYNYCFFKIKGLIAFIVPYYGNTWICE